MKIPNTLLLTGAMTYMSFFSIFLIRHQGLSAIFCFICGAALIYFREEINNN